MAKGEWQREGQKPRSKLEPGFGFAVPFALEPSPFAKLFT
jgi:hypothetical protein